jgi:hypothetical protein
MVFEMSSCRSVCGSTWLLCNVSSKCSDLCYTGYQKALFFADHISTTLGSSDRWHGFIVELRDPALLCYVEPLIKS